MLRMTQPGVIAVAGFVAATALVPGPARAERMQNPLRFFEGRTVSLGTMKVVMKKPVRVRSIGRGEIKPDGSLELVQRVEKEGERAHDRRWHIRQVGPGRFVGSMSEAKGPVVIEEVRGAYRFRFKMPGNLSAEQWLTPLPGGASAISKLIVRKLGVAVARSEGTVRKLK